MSLVGLPTRAPRALDQRVILVSGAHGGLGSAAAAACARAGATVVLLGRKLPKLNRVYDAVAQAGAEPLLYPLDLEGASPDDYAELADRLRVELGHLDGVLHCAVEFKGLTPLEHTDPAAFARAIRSSPAERSFHTYSWNHFRAPGAAAATSSIDVVPIVDSA